MGENGRERKMEKSTRSRRIDRRRRRRKRKDEGEDNRDIQTKGNDCRSCPLEMVETVKVEEGEREC